jgi:hypothetical protein
MRSRREMELRVMYAIVGAVTLACALYLGTAEPATGNTVMVQCSRDAEDAMMSGYCVGGVDGAATALVITGYACIPVGVTTGQLIDIVLKKMQDDPEIRHLEFTIIATSTIAQTYPCIPELDQFGQPIPDSQGQE